MLSAITVSKSALMFRELLIHKCIYLIDENSFIDFGNCWKNTYRSIIDFISTDFLIVCRSNVRLFQIIWECRSSIEWFKSLYFKANISQFSLIIFVGMLVLGYAFDIFSDRISSHTSSYLQWTNENLPLLPNISFIFKILGWCSYFEVALLMGSGSLLLSFATSAICHNALGNIFCFIILVRPVTYQCVPVGRRTYTVFPAYKYIGLYPSFKQI